MTAVEVTTLVDVTTDELTGVLGERVGLPGVLDWAPVGPKPTQVDDIGAVISCMIVRGSGRSFRRVQCK